MVKRHCLHTQAVAERLSFSSYSRTIDDYWGRDIPRPYEIVLLPGYHPPPALDKNHKDSLWYEEEVVEPIAVWDGFSKYALFEIIYECMDYDAYSDFDRKVVVRNAETGEIVSDDRDPELMRYRPRRRGGWGRGATRNHMIDLYAWSLMFRHPDVRRGRETMSIIDDLVMNVRGDDEASPDGVERGRAYKQRRVTIADACEQKASAAPRPSIVLRKGPRPDGADGIVRDNDGVRTYDFTLESWSMRHLVLGDLVPLSSPPRSLFLHAVALARYMNFSDLMRLDPVVLPEPDPARQARASVDSGDTEREVEPRGWISRIMKRGGGA